LTYGEFTAHKRTIEEQAEKLGITLQQINKIAENYQVFGYEVDNDIRDN
jgi:cytidylate kinase